MAGEEKYDDHFQHFNRVHVLYRYPFKGSKHFFLWPFFLSQTDKIVTTLFSAR
jgi:hypothetical protein